VDFLRPDYATVHSSYRLPFIAGTNSKQCGFRGSCTTGHVSIPEEARKLVIPYDGAHIAMTYTALAMLLILGDDFSRVDRQVILAALRDLQLTSGRYTLL